MDSQVSKELAKQTHRADVGRLEVKWTEAERRVHEAVADYAAACERLKVAKSVAGFSPTDFHVKQAAQAAEAQRAARAAVDQAQHDANDVTEALKAAQKASGMPIKVKSIRVNWKPPTPQPKKPTPSFSRYVRDQQKKRKS